MREQFFASSVERRVGAARAQPLEQLTLGLLAAVLDARRETNIGAVPIFPVISVV